MKAPRIPVRNAMRQVSGLYRERGRSRGHQTPWPHATPQTRRSHASSRRTGPARGRTIVVEFVERATATARPPRTEAAILEYRTTPASTKKRPCLSRFSRCLSTATLSLLNRWNSGRAVTLKSGTPPKFRQQIRFSRGSLSADTAFVDRADATFDRACWVDCYAAGKCVHSSASRTKAQI